MLFIIIKSIPSKSSNKLKEKKIEKCIIANIDVDANVTTEKVKSVTKRESKQTNKDNTEKWKTKSTNNIGVDKSDYSHGS